MQSERKASERKALLKRVKKEQKKEQKKQKKKQKDPPPALVQSLKGLCHDVLAEGVLQLNNGLPPTWLETFKEHPVARKQLQQAVLNLSMGRQEPWLNRTSTVMISYTDNECITMPYKFRSFLLPAKGLPKWLYELLSALLKAYVFKPYYSTYDDLPKCAMGGYVLDFSRTNMALWMCNRIESICDHTKGELDELLSGFLLRMCKHLDVQVLSECKSHEEMVSEYGAQTRKAVRSAIEEAQNYFLCDVGNVDELHDKYGKRNEKATYFKAPFATLYFSFNE